MSTRQLMPTLEALIAELEQLKQTQANELAEMRREQTALREELEQTKVALRSQQEGEPDDAELHAGQTSRRKLLGTAAKVAVATLTAGALAAEARPGLALADNAGNFSSSQQGTPAVTATGTNGAIGVSATSDTSIAVQAVGRTAVLANASAGGVGLVATGDLAIQATGNVTAITARADYEQGPAMRVENRAASGQAIIASGTYIGVESGGGDIGVLGESEIGQGVRGSSTTGPGVQGRSSSYVGVIGETDYGPIGVWGLSDKGGVGVQGTTANGGTAVFGDATNSGSGNGTGVLGKSDVGTGVSGKSTAGNGMLGQSASSSLSAILGQNLNSTGGPGIQGDSLGSKGMGVLGTNNSSGIGVRGTSVNGAGVSGASVNNVGVIGESDTGFYGVWGISDSGVGVFAETTGTGLGLDAFSKSGTALRARTGTSNGVAILAQGRILVSGSSVGQATITHGSTSLTVTNPAATANSLILLTPRSDPQVRLWVSATVAGSFMIKASGALPSDVTIQYFIIN